MLADQYSDAANSMDAHGMAAVYAEDAVLISFEHRFEGRAAIEKMFGETISLMELMNQVCSGAVISIDVDRATARWTVTEFAKRKALDKLEMFIGNYDGELVRTPQGWRFSKRVLTRRAIRQLAGAISGAPAMPVSSGQAIEGFRIKRLQWRTAPRFGDPFRIVEQRPAHRDQIELARVEARKHEIEVVGILRFGIRQGVIHALAEADPADRAGQLAGQLLGPSGQR